MSNDSFDLESDAEASAFDELPLWAAPFGLRLLELVRLAPELHVLDVGFGSGFPLFELAMRLGPRATVHGLDPWPAAQRRAAFKRDHAGLSQVQLHQGVAEAMPFADASFDCVVSNNGYNNVADRRQAFRETARVCRQGAQLVFSLNLRGSFFELHEELIGVLERAGIPGARAALDAFIDARRPALGDVLRDLADAGFALEHVLHDSFAFRFGCAAALSSHVFFRRSQLPALRGLVAADRRDAVFRELERRLDDRAERDGELRLTVPFAVVSAARVAHP